MNKNILDEFQPAIIERLGEVYNCSSEYKGDIKKEVELFTQLQNILTKEQMNIVEDYQKAVCATMGVCELLAYRQGMRDLVTILGVEK